MCPTANTSQHVTSHSRYHNRCYYYCSLCCRKNQEFQDALRLQMEEAKRVKDAEKARVEQEKQREYDAYLKHHFKGTLPPTTVAMLEQRNSNVNTQCEKTASNYKYNPYRKARAHSHVEPPGHSGDSMFNACLKDVCVDFA